LAETFLR